MPGITYIQPDGTARTLDVPVGWTAMEGAVRNGVEGILAECGGACACATCHVFVDPAWSGRLPAPSDAEREMLECTADPATADSRLGCQIRVAPELDGLVLRVAATQA